MGEMSDWCGTACALHPHPAAHGMPAHCEVGDAHPTACPCLPMPALHNCSASFPLALPFLRMIWWGKKTKRGRGGQPCASRKISTQMCAPTRTGCRVGDAAGCVTHTRAQLAGIPPSTPQHEEGAWCHHTGVVVCVVVVWATGRHAWHGGHGQLHSFSAWIPPVP